MFTMKKNTLNIKNRFQLLFKSMVVDIQFEVEISLH